MSFTGNKQLPPPPPFFFKCLLWCTNQGTEINVKDQCTWNHELFNSYTAFPHSLAHLWIQRCIIHLIEWYYNICLKFGNVPFVDIVCVAYVCVFVHNVSLRKTLWHQIRKPSCACYDRVFVCKMTGFFFWFFFLVFFFGRCTSVHFDDSEFTLHIIHLISLIIKLHNHNLARNLSDYFSHVDIDLFIGKTSPYKGCQTVWWLVLSHISPQKLSISNK